MVIWRPSAVEAAMRARGRAVPEDVSASDARLARLVKEIRPGQRFPVDYCGAELRVSGTERGVEVEVSKVWD